MGQRRINIQALHKETGLNRNTISNLYHDKAKRIDFDTIDKICKALNCTACDLIEYIPDEISKNPK